MQQVDVVWLLTFVVLSQVGRATLCGRQQRCAGHAVHVREVVLRYEWCEYGCEIGLVAVLADVQLEVREAAGTDELLERSLQIGRTVVRHNKNGSVWQGGPRSRLTRGHCWNAGIQSRLCVCSYGLVDRHSSTATTVGASRRRLRQRLRDGSGECGDGGVGRLHIPHGGAVRPRPV